MLPAKRQQLSVALKSDKAIVQRRAMLELPNLPEVLNPVELAIFKASTKTPIAQLDDRKILEYVNTLLNYIRRDVGLRQEIDQYDRTRFYDVLKKYFSNLTMDEIKTAFELASVGELDQYLPKNSNGEPDRSHYQSFSVEYVSKILTAYKRKKSGAIIKAYKAIPEPKKEPSQEQKKDHRRNFLRSFYKAFLQYKYTGRMEVSSVTEYLIFEELLSIGFITDDIPISEADKKAALSQIMLKASRGIINRFTADGIRKTGTEHEQVKTGAYFIARSKAIKRTFDQLIKEEIQLINYLKL